MATDKIAFADKDRFAAPPINKFRAADANEIKTVVNKLRDDVNLIPAAPEQIARIDELYARTVNVKDYGAVGDGTADDTAAIQDAADAAIGAILQAEPLNYLINGSLECESINLQGNLAHFVNGADEAYKLPLIK